MNTIDRLLAIEEIKQLKARYFRALDTRDMAAFAAVFTKNARIDVRGSVDSKESGSDGTAIEGFDDDAVIVGGDAFATFVEKVSGDNTRVHHGHMPEIEILSDATAKGIWAMEDRLWLSEGPHRLMHGYGHYHETYEMIDGRWLISSMTITRLRVDLL